MTDEQIIAAAGEPVATVLTLPSNHARGPKIEWHVGATVSAGMLIYTSDAILSAVKPLRDRIAELETEVGQLKARNAGEWVDVTATMQKCDELRQKNAELTKQRDGLLDGLDDALKMIPCGTFDDYHLRLMATDRHLSAKAILRYRELISGIRRGAAHKTGGAV